jgi:hypothetical protein
MVLCVPHIWSKLRLEENKDIIPVSNDEVMKLVEA